MAKTESQPRGATAIEPESLSEAFIMYQKPITIGALLLAIAGIGTWLWVRSAQIREERAGASFSAAETAFMSGNKALAQTELERLITRFPGTNAGSQSALLLAQVMYEQGKFAEGMAQLESALRRAADPLKSSMHAMIAAGQEGAGQPLEAAASFGRAADATPFSNEKNQLRMEQARTLAAGGDKAGATAIYREIGSRDDSPFAGEARLRAGEAAAQP